jgi:DNA-binding response OmpR family regulator
MAKILIAEDERDIRELIKFTLEFAGHQVNTAKDGVEAMEIVNEFLPELILLDVRMPRMTGYEVCEQIKQNDTTKNIPVVFLSAKGQEHEVQQGLDIGADAYILKPFSHDELIERINQLLEENAI